MRDLHLNKSPTHIITNISTRMHTASHFGRKLSLFDIPPRTMVNEISLLSPNAYIGAVDRLSGVASTTMVSIKTATVATKQSKGAPQRDVAWTAN
jgi:hypothetical protein